MKKGNGWGIHPSIPPVTTVHIIDFVCICHKTLFLELLTTSHMRPMICNISYSSLYIDNSELLERIKKYNFCEKNSLGI